MGILIFSTTFSSNIDAYYLSLVEGLVILTATIVPEFRSLHVSTRTRSDSGRPKPVPGCLRKDSPAVALAMREHVLGISVDGVSLFVAGRSRALLDLLEAFGFGVDGAERMVAVFGDGESAIFGVEVDVRVASWSWC